MGTIFTILGFVLLVATIVIFLSIKSADEEEQRPKPEDSSGSHTLQKSSRPATELMATPLHDIHRDLSAKGAIGRAIQQRKHQAVSRQTGQMVEADTDLMKKQADQVKTYLSERNEIQRLQDDGELLPLEKDKKASELEADIAENQLRAARARKDQDELHKPPPQPASKPQEDPQARYARHLRERLRELGGRAEAFRALEKELAEKYKDDPELLATQEDILHKIYEEDLK